MQAQTTNETPWLAFAGVLVLAMIPVVSGHVRLAVLTQRLDEVSQAERERVQQTESQRREIEHLRGTLRVVKDEIVGQLDRRLGRVEERLGALAAREAASAGMGQELVDLGTHVSRLVDQLRTVDEDLSRAVKQEQLEVALDRVVDQEGLKRHAAVLEQQLTKRITQESERFDQVLRAESEGLRRALKGIEERVGVLKSHGDRLATLEGSRQRIEEQLSTMNEHGAATEASLAPLQQRIAAIAASMTTLQEADQAAAKRWTDELVKLTQQVEVNQAQANTHKQQLTDLLEQKWNEALKQRDVVKAQIDQGASRHEDLVTKLEDAQKRIMAAHASVAELEQRVAQQLKMIEEVSSRIVTADARYVTQAQELKQAGAGLSASLATLSSQQAGLRELLDQIASRVAALEKPPVQD